MNTAELKALRTVVSEHCECKRPWEKYIDEVSPEVVLALLDRIQTQDAVRDRLCQQAQRMLAHIPPEYEDIFARHMGELFA